MELSRIFFPSFVISKEDLCNISSNENGDMYVPKEIKENCLNLYKDKFVKAGYTVKKDYKNHKLKVKNIDNNIDFNFNFSEIIFSKNPKDVDFNKLLKVLAEVGVEKISASDLSEYKDLQARFIEFNKQRSTEKKKIVKYNHTFRKMGDADYIDVNNISYIENITTITNSVRTEIKRNASMKTRQNTVDNLIELPKEKNVISSNLARVLSKHNTNIDKMWKSVTDSELESFKNKSDLQKVVKKIKLERLKKIKAHKAKVRIQKIKETKIVEKSIEDKKLVEIKIADINKRKQEYRNKPVVIFNQFKPTRVINSSNDNSKKSNDYDMTVNHVVEKLHVQYVKDSELRNSIFEKDDLVNKVSSQWKLYAANQQIKNETIIEDKENKQVRIKLYKSKKHKFDCKMGINKTQPTEVIDHGNRIDVIGSKSNDLYDGLVKIANDRGFKTINFGKIKKEADKEALLLACARIGISPKGDLPKTQEIWDQAKAISSDRGFDWNEFSRFNQEKTVNSKTVKINPSQLSNNNSMVG